MTRTTFCFVALDAERTGIIVRNKTITLGMYLIISVCDVTGCHIPLLGDEELIALLRATDDSATAGLSFDEPAACVGSQTTLLQLELQYPEETRPDTAALLPDTTAKEGQMLRPSPLPSTSSSRFALASPNDASMMDPRTSSLIRVFRKPYGAMPFCSLAACV